jgi:DNA-binding transcriptional MerR regulator
MNDAPVQVEEDAWRIDELAHRAGTSVDTIRFYHRDGLLPPARRKGRSGLYGPDHLRRLEQIRELQGRHFNLAAVKAILDQSHLGAIQAMFSSEPGVLSREELLAKSGLPESLALDIEASGLLAAPDEAGRTGYDQGDLDALRAVKGLIDIGLPEPVALFVARIYAENFAVTQQRMVSLVAGGEEIDWPVDDRIAFIARLDQEAGSLYELTGRLLYYGHRSALRRLLIEASLVDHRDEGPADHHDRSEEPVPPA